MRLRLPRLASMSMLLAALAFGACTDQSPEQLLGPSETAEKSLSLSDDLRAIAQGEVPDLSARYHSAIIGPEGGALYVDLHYLYVPRGAVTGPTKFELRLRDDGRIGVALTATSVSSSGEETGPKNNVGGAGFRKSLYLTFSYAYAKDPPSNPYSIRVVEVKDGRLIPQPTYINKYYKTATGVLHHFSDYAIAWPD